MQKKPLVSVIIPAKNEEANIERLLASIKNQTYPNIEIIVVDDGSTDKTIKISKRFTKFAFSRKHAERSSQRNFGAKKSNGDFLLFIDADMELTKKVVEDSVRIAQKNDSPAVTIAEKTVGANFIAQIRNFERQMYIGDPSIELPRLFKRSVFFEFGGYDPNLTGPEDYDLPYRISKKYKITRSGEYILHHEESLTLYKLLKKKYYYASHGAIYAQKHPELISIQGTILFRKAYIKHWRKFIQKPSLGIAFIFVRTLETIWAVAGFISAVGFSKFLKTLLAMFKSK
jgi:glycosyltransferase involved in cell wall biosynthesis